MRGWCGASRDRGFESLQPPEGNGEGMSPFGCLASKPSVLRSAAVLGPGGQGRTHAHFSFAGELPPSKACGPVSLPLWSWALHGASVTG